MNKYLSTLNNTLMNNILPTVFIGYDSSQHVASQVCEHSIKKYNQHANVQLLDFKKIKEYTRPRDPLASTEFTFTRFLVPYLTGYQGWAVFCDCDFLWRCDVTGLFDLKDNSKAVMVVKHNYTPKSNIKMNNKIQSVYPRKNWSSMILWNCSHPANCVLTPDLVNTASADYLHQFKWLSDDHIGELDRTWNWLAGYYHNDRPKAIHYTDGGPWLGIIDEYSNDWLTAKDEGNF
jgi:lipopolysaccharide biosynthesis glycosyltransferase